MKNAFPYGDIDADIYMKHHPRNHDDITKVCRLLFSLYDLK